MHSLAPNVEIEGRLSSVTFGLLQDLLSLACLTLLIYPSHGQENAFRHRGHADHPKRRYTAVT